VRDTYSLYEAKARLSALVRRVREGGRVVITVHGTPAAELRPVEPEAPGLGDRLERLAERGILLRPEPRNAALAPVATRKGALRRFLDERD
jgi:prevent-host-death family protein